MNSQEKLFIHLRVHSEFSLVDGIVRMRLLVKTVIEQGMPAVAVTDQSFMTSLIRFYQTARSSGVKPICGCDVWVESDRADTLPSSVVLLCMNEVGYKNLMALVSASFQTNQQQGKALLKKQWIFERNEGLIALSGGRTGEIGRALLEDKVSEATSLCKQWQSFFGNRFYLELQRTGRDLEEEYLHAAIKLAENCQCPVVATNDVMFINKEDFDAHEARVCIGEGSILNDRRRKKRYSEAQYLKTPEQMCALFADIPEAIDNTVEIAKRCTIHVSLGTPHLPNFPVPEGMSLNEYFKQLSGEGLERRLVELMNIEDPSNRERIDTYKKRLCFELNIIIQMGFPGYFLIVMDFIQWAKSHKIPVGPGRGSGAGSLVAYALQITDLDPLAYDLLFERFLNPERVSMPDFDVDFCMDNRDKVIEYVAKTYGYGAVSQIVTFGTMAAKAVVKDVARVQGKSYGMADKLSKTIPFEVGMTLAKAFEQEENVRDFLEQNPEAREVWDMALKLEGITRNVGKHAGGVVIAPTKLIDFSPLFCDEDGRGLVTQYDKNDVESVGLVKFDFLGLRTLTIIDWALKMVNARLSKTGHPLVDINNINLADPKAYELLKSGETTAVFQLESRGMKDLIKRLLPDHFEDIIALVALFRPGPLQSGMVDNFINRKHGNEVISYPDAQYQHESLKTILEPTYGIILYQEQVMKIAQVLAGYTLGDADMLRRAMGKKKPEEMAKQRSIFKAGALKHSVNGELAMKIFDLVEKFAGYGFNKSHSAAYALLSYQTLWLKVHYPAEFMAAVLSSDMQNTDKVVGLIEECRSMNLSVLPADVNSGNYMFAVNEKGEIVFGLGAVKGVGEGPVEIVVAGRQSGDYQNLFNFCQRIDAKKLNRRCLEALIYCGAFDKIGPAIREKNGLNKTRAMLIAAVNSAIKTADQMARSHQSGLGDLFGDHMPGLHQEDPYQSYASVEPFTDKIRLNGEKNTLGLYLTGHPIEEYRVELKHFVANQIRSLKSAPKEIVKIAGLVTAMRVMRTKRGDKMAILTVDDQSGRIDVSVFSEVYLASQAFLKTDTIVVIEGEVLFDDYSGILKVNAQKIMDVARARSQYAKVCEIEIYEKQCTPENVQKLQQLIRQNLGSLRIRFVYKNKIARAVVVPSEQWLICPEDEVIQTLKNLLGQNCIHVRY